GKDARSSECFPVRTGLPHAQGSHRSIKTGCVWSTVILDSVQPDPPTDFLRTHSPSPYGFSSIASYRCPRPYSVIFHCIRNQDTCSRSIGRFLETGYCDRGNKESRAVGLLCSLE